MYPLKTRSVAVGGFWGDGTSLVLSHGLASGLSGVESAEHYGEPNQLHLRVEIRARGKARWEVLCTVRAWRSAPSPCYCGLLCVSQIPQTGEQQTRRRAQSLTVPPLEGGNSRKGGGKARFKRLWMVMVAAIAMRVVKVAGGLGCQASPPTQWHRRERQCRGDS